MRKLLALLLFALPVGAQTIQNPSFEAPATLGQAGSAGPWSSGPVPSWTLTGSGGLWQPTSLFALPVPDGSTILWLGKGSVTQDLGVVPQPNTIYTLTVWTGRRSDVWETPTNSYTISFAGCTQTAQLGTIPVGTFTKQVLTCPVGATPPAGNLSVSLGCDGPQCAFDNLSLTSKSSIVPQPITITVKGQLLWCTTCDGTDNSPAVGNLVVAQTGGPSSTQNISADGTVSVSGTIDIAQASLEFTIMLTDANGATQPGATLTLTFPRFELASPGFTLGTITLGVVRIAHTVDASGAPAVRIVDFGPFSLGK